MILGETISSLEENETQMEEYDLYRYSVLILLK